MSISELFRTARLPRYSRPKPNIANRFGTVTERSPDCRPERVLSLPSRWVYGRLVIRSLAAFAAIGVIVAAGLALGGAAAATPVTLPSGSAPGAPGAVSHFDLARKDCLGTARNTTSKVWYTVAGGVLSDVYYPTVDNTNVETLQYVVTDGQTFTDLQTRDMTYAVRALPATGGMACEVTATAKNGRYAIRTEYVTDP